MNTPWGKSDSKINIERGVSWVSTPSHGGLAITIPKALETLSWPARKIANGSSGILLYKGKPGYLFFEEDCAYAIAFYEHPEWYRSLAVSYSDMAQTNDSPYAKYALKYIENSHKSSEQIKAEMAEVIRRYFPEYFGQEAI